eukprot:m.180823 g.180823  ORF g.180823 m.180823 type:complete len:433 (-) comp32037_c0_seq1:100-1398(-)
MSFSRVARFGASSSTVHRLRRTLMNNAHTIGTRGNNQRVLVIAGTAFATASAIGLGYYNQAFANCDAQKDQPFSKDVMDAYADALAFDPDYKKEFAPYLGDSITPDLETLLQDPEDYRAKMEDMIMKAQATIVNALSAVDNGAKFTVDRYERPNGQGGGLTTVIQDSDVFEKAGVNISVIRGDLKPQLATQMTSQRGKKLGPGPHTFFASGISSVIHPRNPMVPTMHFNYRYFEVTASDGTKTWWYGGGADLTPYYLEESDGVHFHTVLKDSCDAHNRGFYPAFKKACDDYFMITHRKERRGIGGVVFDDLAANPASDLHLKDQASTFKFVTDMAASVNATYIPIVIARKDLKYTEQEREWQLIRRGRYVEFNLVYDRGTKFGLVTPQARIESIFISLPLNARWEYKHEVADDSREGELMKILREPREWVET